VELTAKTTRVEAFLSLVKPFGVLESARTGEHCMLVSRRGDIDIVCKV
jgi:acetolactate synthase-1/3 small subunit